MSVRGRACARRRRVRASAAPPPPLPHRSHARPPSPALAGEASQAALAAAAIKLVVDFKLVPDSITGATIMSCGGETAIRTRLGAAADGAARLVVVKALDAEAEAASVARGAFARGRACARRRGVRASAAPPPPLPHRSHARPPSPALAGEALQAALAAAAVKIVDDFKLKPGSITGATITSCGGEAAIRKRLGAAATIDARLAVVKALVAEAKAAKAASGAFARGRACARRRERGLSGRFEGGGGGALISTLRPLFLCPFPLLYSLAGKAGGAYSV